MKAKLKNGKWVEAIEIDFTEDEALEVLELITAGLAKKEGINPEAD